MVFFVDAVTGRGRAKPKKEKRKTPKKKRTGRGDPVLVRERLPELGADLVAALAGLQCNYFTHGWV